MAHCPIKLIVLFIWIRTMVFEQTKASLLNDQPVVIAITIDRNYFGARDEDGYVYL